MRKSEDLLGYCAGKDPPVRIVLEADSETVRWCLSDSDGIRFGSTFSDSYESFMAWYVTHLGPAPWWAIETSEERRARKARGRAFEKAFRAQHVYATRVWEDTGGWLVAEYDYPGPYRKPPAPAGGEDV
jgi:hypothetical protein